ncbi:hypothetical protein CRUP_032112 [Coryphaenoides rupestris]|nr:hypothetical protein CRUP_032112 [Coryphaenoides rupestris]
MKNTFPDLEELDWSQTHSITPPPPKSARLSLPPPPPSSTNLPLGPPSQTTHSDTREVYSFCLSEGLVLCHGTSSMRSITRKINRDPDDLLSTRQIHSSENSALYLSVSMRPVDVWWGTTTVLLQDGSGRKELHSCGFGGRGRLPEHPFGSDVLLSRTSVNERTP